MSANVDPHKLIALKLLSVNWFDRLWLMAKLDKATAKAVKNEISQLKKMRLQNPAALLAQLEGNHEPATAEDTTADIDKLGLSDEVKVKAVALAFDGGKGALSLRKALNEYLTQNQGVER